MLLPYVISNLSRQRMNSSVSQILATTMHRHHHFILIPLNSMYRQSHRADSMSLFIEISSRRSQVATLHGGPLLMVLWWWHSMKKVPDIVLDLRIHKNPQTSSTYLCCICLAPCTVQKEIGRKIPGCTVTMHGHVAMWARACTRNYLNFSSSVRGCRVVHGLCKESRQNEQLCCHRQTAANVFFLPFVLWPAFFAHLVWISYANTSTSTL